MTDSIPLVSWPPAQADATGFTLAGTVRSYFTQPERGGETLPRDKDLEPATTVCAPGDMTVTASLRLKQPDYHLFHVIG